MPKRTCTIYLFIMIIMSWFSENALIAENICPCDKKKTFYCFRINNFVSETNFRHGSTF